MTDFAFSRKLIVTVATIGFLTLASTLNAHENFSLRINCGGTDYVDTFGNTWMSDTYFSGSSNSHSVSLNIASTGDDPLYRVSRVGRPFFYDIPLENATYSLTLHFAENQATFPGTRVFDVFAEGVEIITDLDIIAEVGTLTAMTRQMDVTVSDGTLDLDFVGNIGTCLISGIEIVDLESGHPFLHVVTDTPSLMVDYDDDGIVAVELRGDESHTHEIGHVLTSHTWTTQVPGPATPGGGGSMVDRVLGSGQTITCELTPGPHPITLTIEDDNIPAETLSGTVNLPVYRPHRVGGVFARYFTRSAGPGKRQQRQEFVEVLEGLKVEPNGNQIGGSPLTVDTRVVMEGNLEITTAGSYQFQLLGGSSGVVSLNGARVQGARFLDVGDHSIRVIAMVNSAADLPLEVEIAVDGGGFSSVSAADLHHDQRELRPFINTASQSGSEFGGELITLTGWGFFPPESLMVRWGNQVLMEPDLTIGQNEITFLSPAGTGTLNLSIETTQGQSNSRPYTFIANQAPIVFNTTTLDNLSNPTRAAWGPDGRLYVGTLDGALKIYTFDEDWAITHSQTVTTIQALSNPEILGLAFNPLDPPTPPKIYIAHCELFAHNGGDCFVGASPYNGQVSTLEGPNFDTVTPVITNLPVSNHDHGINELLFDNHGDLFLASGGNTNAGIDKCTSGGLKESPLTGGILWAPMSDPLFNGAIQYYETGTDPQVINNDQVFGDIVSVVNGVTVYPFAMGVRNSFGMVLTTDEGLYCTDNGPNSGFGVASLSATTQGSIAPQDDDELLRPVQGGYYGHPNRNYGRTFDYANVYRGAGAPPVVGEYIAPLLTHASSINGVFQYRASTFGNAMRNDLVFQKWNGEMTRVELASDGMSVVTSETINNSPDGLDALQGPGGVILSVDYSGDKLLIAEPTDAAINGLTAYDIFPWRALADGTVPFVIGGENFGSLSDMVVTIGGQTAVLTSVTSKRLHGFIPSHPMPSADLLDVVVQNTSTAETEMLLDSFRYVFEPGDGAGAWESETTMPADLAEVAAAAVSGVIYVFGSENPDTFAYDLSTKTWSTSRAQRPFLGDHHSAEVIGHRVYLLGGLEASEGRLQIYDPLLDQWTLGAPIPFATGSASTAVIDGKIYVAGGFVNNSTVTDAAVYDPELNSWSTIASMPVGRNHAASGTDGEKLYVFGGRGPGSGNFNTTAIGFDDVMIYDPVTDQWEASFDVGSTIPPVPQKRGGMGKAPYFRGEFYVMGGETTSQGTGQVAGNVYDRVDVYDPIQQTWRLDTAMPNPRHGIYPILCDRKIYVISGGVVASISSSDIVDVFRH